MSFNPDKSHTLTISLQKDHLANPPFYSLNNPPEEVRSFSQLGLTISHDVSWTNSISKLASKANRQLGILHRSKSFLGTPDLLSTHKAFIRMLMEYCFPLWAGSPASHLLCLMLWKPRALGLLESPVMNHFTITDRSVLWDVSPGFKSHPAIKFHACVLQAG